MDELREHEHVRAASPPATPSRNSPRRRSRPGLRPARAAVTWPGPRCLGAAWGSRPPGGDAARPALPSAARPPHSPAPSTRTTATTPSGDVQANRPPAASGHPPRTSSSGAATRRRAGADPDPRRPSGEAAAAQPRRRSRPAAAASPPRRAPSPRAASAHPPGPPRGAHQPRGQTTTSTAPSRCARRREQRPGEPHQPTASAPRCPRVPGRPALRVAAVRPVAPSSTERVGTVLLGVDDPEPARRVSATASSRACCDTCRPPQAELGGEHRGEPEQHAEQPGPGDVGAADALPDPEQGGVERGVDLGAPHGQQMGDAVRRLLHREQLVRPVALPGGQGDTVTPAARTTRSVSTTRGSCHHGRPTGPAPGRGGRRRAHIPHGRRSAEGSVGSRTLHGSGGIGFGATGKNDHMAPDTDAVLTAVLARFAAVASLALAHPGGWLGRGDDAPSRLPVRALQRARRLVTGRVHPGAPGWDELPVERRDAWWVGRDPGGRGARRGHSAGVRARRRPVAHPGRLRDGGRRAHRLRRRARARRAGPGRVGASARPRAVRPRAGTAQPGTDRRSSRQAPPPQSGPLRKAGAALWRLTQVLWEAPSVFDEKLPGAQWH